MDSGHRIIHRHRRVVDGDIDTLISYYTASGKSLARHLESWTRRHVRCEGGLLYIGKSASKSKLQAYCIIPNTLKRHYYASSDRKHSLSLCCLNGETSQEMEVKLSFKSREETNGWLKVFEEMLSDLSDQQRCVLLHTMKSVSNYLHNRNEMPKICSSGALAALPLLDRDDDEDAFEVVDNPSQVLIQGIQQRLAIADNSDGADAAGLEKLKEAPRARCGLSNATLRSHQRPYWSLPIPKLRIVIMTVGTRGDVQPFILLGQRLRQDGHRVRLASHEIFRDLVVKENGLEFYPLGGDPHWLSQFMVKTKGFILPMSLETLSQVPKNVAMINEIIHSCWGACIYPDPKDETRRAFIADAIISNPVTYGHVHCAEALGIPLHLMFPQPWVPTKAFPHPLSGMKYTHTEWSASNYLSYQTVDGMMWQSFLPYINNFRMNTLKLAPIRFLEKTWDVLNYHRVPFVKMWSRHLAPKPKDWPDHVDIVGAFVTPDDNDKAAAASDKSKAGIKITSSDVAAAADSKDPLEAFLNAPNTVPPIFVGFGSMVVDKPEQLIRMMLEGAALADVRILVQSGWSDINQEWFLRTAQGIERRFNREYISNSNMTANPVFAPKSHLGSDARPGDQSKEPTLESSILGAIGQPMSSPAASNSDSGTNSFDSGVLRRPRGPSEGDEFAVSSSKGGDLDMPGIGSSVRGTKWRATDALLIGNYPHDKLFPRMAAVVHHGGAGTTAGGLIAGKPTFICPFFGDQNFWGEMVRKAGFGPAPCPVEQLTAEIIAEKFVNLLSPDVQSRARKVSVDMKAEGDGVTEGLLSFYRHLPIENMVCDVSLMKHEVRLAQVYCKTCGLKMARDVSDALHATLCDKAKAKSIGEEPLSTEHDVAPCLYVDWSLPPPGGLVDGVLQGAGALAHETIGAIADAFTDPLKGVYYGGIQGGLKGMYSGFRSLAVRPVEGTRVMYSKVAEGMRGTTEPPKHVKTFLGAIDGPEGEHSSGVENVGSNPELYSSDVYIPEQAARWYGDASMMRMSSAAQAMAEKSFLFSEEDQITPGAANDPAATGSGSVVQRYGTQAIMESTIIEELDYEDSIDDDDERPLSEDEVFPANDGLIGDGSSSSVTVPGDETLLSISGILDKLDSTNAAIARYAEPTASAILHEMIPDFSPTASSVLGYPPVDVMDEDVQSVVEEDGEEEEETASIVVSEEGGSGLNEHDILTVAPAQKSVISASMVDRSVVMKPRQVNVSVDQSVILYDGTLAAMNRRPLLTCYFMARQLQKIMSSLTDWEEFSQREPVVKDFSRLVSAAISSAHCNGGAVFDTGTISKVYGRLLSAPDILFNTSKRQRKRMSLADLLLLFLQEELPGADVSSQLKVEDDGDGAAATAGGLTSMYWAFHREDSRDVWIDKDDVNPTV